MKTISIVKLMLVFAVVFSLASFSGAISSNFQLPSVHVARATVAPCSTPGSPCSESWVPAGPAMDTFLGTIFTDESAEFQNIQGAAPTIDLTDWPLTPDLLSPFTTNSAFYITSTISEHGYFEIQFMLGAGNFWGCNMNFGNSQCGIDIRQGISHLIDKTKFTSTEPTEKGISSPIDNPLPTSNGGLPSPNPCHWDNAVVPAALQPVLGTSLVQTGSNCIVGAPGGTSYHLASASGGGGIAWLPSLSDLDMCAAAAHFIDAGLAAGVVNPSTNPTLRNCSLAGLVPAVTAGGITFFVRSDNTPRLHLGDSVADAMCALLTGSYTTGCGTDTGHTNIVKVQHGPITAFTGFTTSTNHIDVSWHMYTAAFGSVFPFDSSLYLGYNSRFVSGISSTHVANGGTCTNDSVPTASAGNYMYVCNTQYDNISNQMEFANCLTASGDPTSSKPTATYAICSGTLAFAVTAGKVINALGTATSTASTPQQTYTVTLTGTSGTETETFTVAIQVTNGAALTADVGTGFGFAPAGYALDPTLKTNTVNIKPPNPGDSGATIANYKANPPIPGPPSSAEWTIQAAAGKYNTFVVTCTISGTGQCATVSAGGGPTTTLFGPSDAVVVYTKGTTVPTITPTGVLISVPDPLFIATTNNLSAVSAGALTEDLFGKAAYTMPIFQQADQFGYLSHTPGNTAATWNRVINHFGNGLPNYYTWLNAWNGAPAQPGTIRQGFKQTTRTVSPFISSTVWDFYVVGNVYDSLHNVNPLNNAEDLSWMDISALPQTTLTYTPPAGTVLTYRFTLMPNLNWQDGKPVTSFDVAFSYLSLLANGAFVSGGAATLSGVTILSPTQFDLNLKSTGPFTRLFLTGLPIMPGRYWTCGTGTQPSTGVAPNIAPAPCPVAASSQWDSGITTCTSVGNTCYPVQYTLGNAPLQSACYPNAAAPCAQPAQAALSGAASFVANLMNVDAVKTGALYDPIAGHILIGSGPWTCGTGAGLGQNCAPGNIMNPGTGQSYTLQRNGLGITPGFPGDYFRSSGFLATWLWSGDIAPGVNNFSAAKACFGVTPLAPLAASPPTGCGLWQQGIGTNGATTPAGTGGCPAGPTPCGIPVGSNQVSIVKLYININWVYPDVWNSISPPNGIIALDPVLYAGSAGTLSPATGTGGVGCASAYPTGGYDC